MYYTLKVQNFSLAKWFVFGLLTWRYGVTLMTTDSINVDFYVANI